MNYCIVLFGSVEKAVKGTEIEVVKVGRGSVSEAAPETVSTIVMNHGKKINRVNVTVKRFSYKRRLCVGPAFFMPRRERR